MQAYNDGKMINYDLILSLLYKKLNLASEFHLIIVKLIKLKNQSTKAKIGMWIYDG